MVANTALFNLFLFNHFCNVFKFELQCKFLQKFDILQILKVLSYKEKVLLHCSIFGGGTNIKFLVIQLSAIWHYLLCVQKIWLTLRYSVYHWMARGITVTENSQNHAVEALIIMLPWLLRCMCSIHKRGSEVFDTQIISHQNFIYNRKKKYWPTSYKRIYF